MSGLRPSTPSSGSAKITTKQNQSHSPITPTGTTNSSPLAIHPSPHKSTNAHALPVLSSHHRKPTLQRRLGPRRRHRLQKRRHVTNLQGPPLAQANREKIDALKRRAQEIACDLRSRDDIQISYLETLEECDNDNLRLAQMLAG
jgi:hypothetical protein